MPAGGILIAYTLAAIGLLLALILWARLHAFLALLLTSMALGLACGMGPAKVLKSIQTGFGEALGFIAVVVALGAMIGRFLEHSGGGRALADSLLRTFGKDRAVWAVLVSAFLIGLPIFFEVGFIILVPVAWSLARESKTSLLYFGLPIAAALTVTHAMVPPHPAPAAAAQLLGADLGKTILYGIAVSIPMAIAGGIFYSSWISKRLYIPVPERVVLSTAKSMVPVPLVVFLLLLPVLLIFASTIWKGATLGFIGHPFTALAITALASMYFLGMRCGLDRNAIAKMTTDSLAPIGTLLAIMGGGGAFKQVIVDSGVGPYAGKLLIDANVFADPGLPRRRRHASRPRLGHRSHHHRRRHRRPARQRHPRLLRRNDRPSPLLRRHHPLPRQRRRLLASQRKLRNDRPPDPPLLDHHEGHHLASRHRHSPTRPDVRLALIPPAGSQAPTGATPRPPSVEIRHHVVTIRP
jgi:gluconate transporter